MGTWGPGTFENDLALDLVDDLGAELVFKIEAFCDGKSPDIDDRFTRAFAAAELLLMLLKKTPSAAPRPADVERWGALFLGTFDRKIDEHQTDARYKKAQRKALEKLFEALAAQAIEFHRGEPGAPSSALSRRLARRVREQRVFGPALHGSAELQKWVAPYGEDLAKMWAECPSGRDRLVIAQVLGVPHARLVEIVTDLAGPWLARLPPELSLADPEALDAWGLQAIGKPGKSPLPTIASAAALLARARLAPERDHLERAVHELLTADKIDASILAERAGMSWMTAMTSGDGPGWGAFRATDAELSRQILAKIPASELRL